MKKIIDQFANKKVLVIGDLVLDEYWFGNIGRVSREAPVLILNYDSKEHSLGGAANALNNIAALGAEVFPISAIGDDESSATLFKIFKKIKINTQGIIKENYLHTPTKIRFMAGCLHTAKQQVLRVDKESQEKLKRTTELQLIENFKKILPKVDAVLISDYGIGNLSPLVIEFLNEQALVKKVPFVLDSRYNLSAYKNITLAAPNEEEAASTLNKLVITEDTVFNDTKNLEKILNANAGLITLGKEGMALTVNDKNIKIDAVGSKDCVDVTGAGDTVCGVLTLALAANAGIEVACRLANAAASQVVMQRGTATVSYHNISKLIDKYLT
ncbi:MAG: carbohydrate kinase [bacterium]|nr:carbohydrate kinase [bacterium]